MSAGRWLVRLAQLWSLTLAFVCIELGCWCAHCAHTKTHTPCVYVWSSFVDVSRASLLVCATSLASVPALRLYNYVAQADRQAASAPI
jgi:hypothetical protein